MSRHIFNCLCLLGGLAEEVDEKVLHAAFIPFGDITDIQIPLDYETGKMSKSVKLSADIFLQICQPVINVAHLSPQKSTEDSLSLNSSLRR